VLFIEMAHGPVALAAEVSLLIGQGCQVLSTVDRAIVGTGPDVIGAGSCPAAHAREDFVRRKDGGWLVYTRSVMLLASEAPRSVGATKMC